MEKRADIEARYARLWQEYDGSLRQAKERIRRVSLLRVVLFLAAVAGAVMLYPRGLSVWGGWVAVCTAAFLYLVKYHAALFRKKQWLEVLCRVYEDERSALRGDYAAFDGGEAFIAPSHDYTYDLDVFGRHSLFQSLNRTCTQMGCRRLADWLSHHATSVPLLRERQRRVQFLASRPTFREQFRAVGLLTPQTSFSTADVEQWAGRPVPYVHTLWGKVALWGVPLVNALLIGGALTGLLPAQLAGSVFCLFLVGSLFLQRRITLVLASYDWMNKQFHTYADLLRAMEEELPDDDTFATLTARLRVDGCRASDAVELLGKRLDKFDRRNNVLVSLVLDGLYLWQLRQLAHLEQWRRAYGRHLSAWLDVVGETDALNALATFAYNHPEAVYAEWSEQAFVFEARCLRHPLMEADRCVPNDVSLPACPYFVVVTGANMAGKSTYLRTVGVNYLLACVGAPALCESIRLYPAALVTSLRTTDSLANGESYFFAELKRLQRMLERLEAGEKLFIVLDEILKGTNSLDKQRGSLALVRKLMQLGTDGIIATHDLQLATLADSFPGQIANACFEADIKGDELTFSYRMRPGVASNMNACFLMRRMGLDIEE